MRGMRSENLSEACASGSQSLCERAAEKPTRHGGRRHSSKTESENVDDNNINNRTPPPLRNASVRAGGGVRPVRCIGGPTGQPSGLLKIACRRRLRFVCLAGVAFTGRTPEARLGKMSEEKHELDKRTQHRSQPELG
jgi:hypothetical protein